MENMENLENSGNFKNCQNIRENSGKFLFFFLRKTWKTKGKCKICGISPNENLFQRFFSLESHKGKNLNLVSQKFGHHVYTTGFVKSYELFVKSNEFSN